MKHAKKVALAELMGQLVDDAIELGMARQRHEDAAMEESMAFEDLSSTGSKVNELLNSGKPDKSRLH